MISYWAGLAGSSLLHPSSSFLRESLRQEVRDSQVPGFLSPPPHQVLPPLYGGGGKKLSGQGSDGASAHKQAKACEKRLKSSKAAEHSISDNLYCPIAFKPAPIPTPHSKSMECHGMRSHVLEDSPSVNQAGEHKIIAQWKGSSLFHVASFSKETDVN